MPDRFAEYVPLGHNCEVAFQVRRVLGRDDTSFFAWNVTELDALIDLIRYRFHGILQPNQISWDEKHQLCRDNAYGYLFHGPWQPGVPQRDPLFAEKLADHQAKAAHQIEHFLNPRGRRAYFYKPPFTPPGDKAVTLANLLQERTPDSVLVLLQHSEHTPVEAWHPKMLCRRLSRFAPVGDATDGHVASWDRIFAEFPHADGLRIAYDKAAAARFQPTALLRTG